MSCEAFRCFSVAWQVAEETFLCGSKYILVSNTLGRDEQRQKFKWFRDDNSKFGLNGFVTETLIFQ